MDDGGAHKSGLLLHTNNFTLVEVEVLIKLLSDKYGIKANLWDKGGKYVIYITAESMPTLRSVVTQHIHSTFLYKLGTVSQSK